MPMNAAKNLGSCDWVFPDGDLPAPGNEEPYGHESLIIVNLTQEDAHIKLDFLFEGEEPVRDVAVEVKAERVHCVRLDQPVGEQEYRVPLGQYALHLKSSTPVVCQIGRMDRQAPNLAYYTVMGFPLQ